MSAVASFEERAAFDAECEAARATLEAAAGEPDVASRPGLGEWGLPRLVGHLVGVTRRAADRLALGAPDAARAEIDRAGYYTRHMALEAAGAFTPAADPDLTDPAAWPSEFASARQATAQALDDAGDPDTALVDSPNGAMTVREYTATRVLEVCVHHLDVRVALDLPPAPTPQAGTVTQELLERLLDGPRPRNLGRTRFIRAATGRGGYDDPRFPVLV